jgi:hypothetical protein
VTGSRAGQNSSGPRTNAEAGDDRAELDAKAGRDHNGQGFTCWLAGGGIKSGMTYGETDEVGVSLGASKPATDGRFKTSQVKWDFSSFPGPHS